MNSKNVISRIRIAVEPIYNCGKFYSGITIWAHALAVAQFAREFAVLYDADEFVSEAAGLLHDVGAALYGREDHHRTGVSEAGLILFEAGCATEYMWPIFNAIYSHRGSIEKRLFLPSAVCVAAADAKDHFLNLGEVWLAQERRLATKDISIIYPIVYAKVQKDWEKTSPEIRAMLNGSYEQAIDDLEGFLLGVKKPQVRQQELVLV